MNIEKLFNFFEEPEEGKSEKKVVTEREDITKIKKDPLLSRFLPSLELILEKLPEGRGREFIDVIILLKGIESYTRVDLYTPEIGRNSPTVLENYSKQRDSDFNRFYQLLVRNSTESFLSAIKGSSYEGNINYIKEILNHLILSFLITEEYEKCAEIKIYMDSLDEKS